MDMIRIYDPMFILRFSIHTLLMGYIEPAEFSRVGLLAITLVCISSPDEELRKLAYESLNTFRQSLEVMFCYFRNPDILSVDLFIDCNYVISYYLALPAIDSYVLFA